MGGTRKTTMIIWKYLGTGKDRKVDVVDCAETRLRPLSGLLYEFDYFLSFSRQT